ncbi:MAG: hypothetical protein ACYC46_10490 [Acidobacteriaceae bacterium]
MPNRLFWNIVLVVTLAGVVVGPLCGQTLGAAQIPQNPRQNAGQPSRIPNRPELGTAPDEHMRKIMEEQAKKRNIERQKKLVEDTDKLLLLATELKASVDQSTKDTLSLDVIKKADEIEKLAKSVKQRMKAD